MLSLCVFFILLLFLSLFIFSFSVFHFLVTHFDWVTLLLRNCVMNWLNNELNLVSLHYFFVFSVHLSLSPIYAPLICAQSHLFTNIRSRPYIVWALLVRMTHGYIAYAFVMKIAVKTQIAHFATRVYGTLHLLLIN